MKPIIFTTMLALTSASAFGADNIATLTLRDHKFLRAHIRREGQHAEHRDTDQRRRRRAKNSTPPRSKLKKWWRDIRPARVRGGRRKQPTSPSSTTSASLLKSNP